MKQAADKKAASELQQLTVNKTPIWFFYGLLKYLNMSGIQKVCRLIQFSSRIDMHIVHLYILLLFAIVYSNWNALGDSVFFQRVSVVEELLILVFQPEICHAEEIIIISEFASFHEFQLQSNNKLCSVVVPDATS